MKSLSVHADLATSSCDYSGGASRLSGVESTTPDGAKWRGKTRFEYKVVLVCFHSMQILLSLMSLPVY